ncbi:ribbon-helix-helix domain-containing protein [Mycobacterium tuberculosis]|uniref:ribbon-helix-helix domain-containing protein n=1 Tax=Mycobacterium tuberculosis TaxID=1773 RepID=UPI000931B0CC
MGSAIDNELLEKLKDLSKETKVPQSKLLDEAIELLLREYKNDDEQAATKEVI